MSRYLVVQFINSKDGLIYFDVVPKEWRINDRTCYWPIDWSYKKIREAVKNRIPLDIDWSVNQYVKLANTFTFEQADFLAERELMRYNKKLKRKQLEEIRKRIKSEQAEEEEEESDSSSSSDSSIICESDSSNIESDRNICNKKKPSCELSSESNVNGSNSTKDQPLITVSTERMSTGSAKQNVASEIGIECPQLSISDDRFYFETDNAEISRLINEPCVETNFTSDLS